MARLVWKCLVCGKEFAGRNRLYAHICHNHNTSMRGSKRKIKCPRRGVHYREVEK
ncbi:MAG: hypothetical protein ACXQTM_01755 [Methanosarcinales archaeon]